MVLESIIGERNIRKKPFLLFLITVLLGIVSIFFADMLFPEHGSVLSVAFVTIAIVPVLHNILASEESDELLERKSAATFFARHFNLLLLYVWVFIGMIVAFTLVYAVSSPHDKTLFFDEQISAFCSISGSDSCTNGIPHSITAKVASTAFSACQSADTKNVVACTAYILQNNASVLFFILILSFVYGAGAIFIIAWNASILGVFFGEMILSGQVLKIVGFVQGMLIGHGPPELLSYVFAALAGAILSAAISKRDFLRHEGAIITRDVIFLIILAVFSVLYGAATEAIGLMGWGDLYYIVGFVYVLMMLGIVYFYGIKSRSNGAKLSY